MITSTPFSYRVHMILDCLKYVGIYLFKHPSLFYAWMNLKAAARWCYKVNP
jgi:hypothetical protein